MTALFLWRQQPVLARDVAGVLRKPVRSEDFSPYWTDELSLAVVVSTAQKTKKSALSLFWRNYSRRHWSPRFRMLRAKLARGCVVVPGDDG